MHAAYFSFLCPSQVFFTFLNVFVGFVLVFRFNWNREFELLRMEFNYLLLSFFILFFQLAIFVLSAF